MTAQPTSQQHPSKAPPLSRLYYAMMMAIFAGGGK